MKDLTSELRYKFEDSSIQTCKIGKHEFIVPEWVLKKLENRTKYYEVEDVQDLFDNYKFLSRTSRSPFSVSLYFTLQKLIALTKGKGDLLNLDDKIKYNELTSSGNGINFNLVDIFNVYLRNFSFVKRQIFRACEFDIVDRNEQAVRGVFIYRHHSMDNLDDFDKYCMSHLEKVINASQSTTFDLTFNALPEDYVICLKPLVLRGKKLLVKEIKRHYRKKESVDMPEPSERVPDTPKKYALIKQL